MAKITLSSIPSGYATAAAHNADNTAIEAAIENTLSRDGTSPNQMNANLDMNGYAILNQRATSGNENFIWMGTWTTGTTYSVNNLVYAPEGTNLGNTLICVTANTAGATLDGDAAKWAVFAQRGASGAGTGDVNGPASSTADSLARFSGTTGKLLKDGAVIGTDVQAYSAKLDSYVSNTLTAANKIPYATALDTAGELTLDIDGTLAANSDTTIASQKAIKTYVDTKVASNTSLVAATSQSALGTTISFSSIPSGTKRIIVILSGVSSNGGSSYQLQLGTSSGYTISGYTSSADQLDNITGGISSTTGLLILGASAVASETYTGIITIVNINNNTWVATGNILRITGSLQNISSGSISLSSTLDSLRLTTINGTDSFDAGTVNIFYE